MCVPACLSSKGEQGKHGCMHMHMKKMTSYHFCAHTGGRLGETGSINLRHSGGAQAWAKGEKKRDCLPLTYSSPALSLYFSHLKEKPQPNLPSLPPWEWVGGWVEWGGVGGCQTVMTWW